MHSCIETQLRTYVTCTGRSTVKCSILSAYRCLQVPGGCSRQLGGWRRRLRHPVCADLRASGCSGS